MKKNFEKYGVWVLLGLAAIYVLYILTRATKAAGDVASNTIQHAGQSANDAIDTVQGDALGSFSLLSPIGLWGTIARNLGLSGGASSSSGNGDVGSLLASTGEQTSGF